MKNPKLQITNIIEETHGDRLHHIAAAAYFKAEKRGFAAGNELEDWLEAEREVDEETID